MARPRVRPGPLFRAGLLLAVLLPSAPTAAAPEHGVDAVPPDTVVGPRPPDIDLEATPARFSTPTPWKARPLAAEAHASLGGPLGLVGAAFDVSTSDELSTGLGIGIAESSKSLHAAALLRVRLLLTRTFATGAEGAVAVGDYVDDVDCHRPGCEPTYAWRPAFWGSLGLFLESRSDSGTTLRAGFGAGAIFNVADARCKRCGPADEPSMWVTTVPYAGIVVGRAFSW